MKTRPALKEVRMAALGQADQFPRYKQKLASMGRQLHGPHFEPDPNFDVKSHVHAVTLPHPAGKRELDELMGMFIAREWDLTRPLWEMLLVENYLDEDGAQCALLTRGHHTLADGQGFVMSQLYMTSYRDELVEEVNGGARKLDSAKHGRLRPSQYYRSLRRLDPLVDNRFTAPLARLSLAFLFWSAYFFSAFVSLFWSTYQGLHQAIFFLLTCWRVEMLTEDYRGPRVTEREFSSSRTYSMEDVKLCQQAFSGPQPNGLLKRFLGDEKNPPVQIAHVTLNDVLCSVMADVLGEEIRNKPRGHGLWDRIKLSLKHILPSPIGFFIPISIRKPGDWSLRNLSTGSMVYLYPSGLPTATTLPDRLHAHIHACRSELSLLKHSVWPKLLFNLTQLTGQAPITWPVPFALLPKLLSRRVRNVFRDWIIIPVVRFSLESFPVILTNVPGPSKNLTLAGVEVIKWTALPPQAGKGTIGLGVISYAGGICISVATDKVPGTEGAVRRICERFEKRFDVYITSARQVVKHQ